MAQLPVPGAAQAVVTRRELLLGAAAAPFAVLAMPPAYTGKLCLFSKHLPQMDWRRLARTVKQLGFDGVDLTVRKDGHVAPERAAEDLPATVAAIREEGLEVPMITTGLLSVRDPAAEPTLAAAGKTGIPFCKPGYYKYDFVDVRKELEKVAEEFRALAGLARQHGVQIGYHNHAGYVGAPVWDIARMLEGLDSKWAGYYFDVCHAVTEGGEAGWKIALNMAAPRIKMASIKDFYWEKSSGRGWRPRFCPLGEGMVDWKYYFQALAKAGFQGPISLHLEYEIPGATAAAREENTLAAAQRDFEFLKRSL